jgi:hypothetical protein
MNTGILEIRFRLMDNFEREKYVPIWPLVLWNTVHVTVNSLQCMFVFIDAYKWTILCSLAVPIIGECLKPTTDYEAKGFHSCHIYLIIAVKYNNYSHCYFMLVFAVVQNDVLLVQIWGLFFMKFYGFNCIWYVPRALSWALLYGV